MSATVIEQPSVESVDGITSALAAVFGALRTAVLAGESVVMILDDRDLLGQGTAVDAAVATAMLGLLRAFALEGVRDGWSVNAITHRDDRTSADEMVAQLDEQGDFRFTGQVLRVGTTHIGKVSL